MMSHIPVFDDPDHPMPSTSSYPASYVAENRENLSTPIESSQQTL